MTRWLVCVLLITAAAHAAAIDTIYQSTFETAHTWSARSGMTLSVESRPEGGNALRVRGLQSDGWNYATSARFALTAGHIYRLEAWLRTDSLDRRSYPPYLKIQFLGLDDQMATTRYDMSAGGWQMVSLEFECPAGDTGGWLAIEKGTNTPVYADLIMDNVLLAELDAYSPHPYHFTTVPAGLDSLKNRHPRLYLTAQSLALLRSRVAHEPWASLLTGLRTIADRAVTNGPPAYVVGTDEEQLYQRGTGNGIPHLAMAYLLTGDNRYLTSARQWMLTSAGYPTWGLGTIDGSDLAAGHQMYGLALAYDWLYAELDSAARDSVRSCLVRRGSHIFDLMLNDSYWWTTSYLQNHQYVSMTGLAAAGFALYGGAEDLDGWMLLPLVKFKRAVGSLAPDGAGHEGIPYWEYGLEYLLKFMELARPLLGEDLYDDSPFFRNTAQFRLYGMLPMDSWRTNSWRLMTFADGPRYDWYGPDYLLRRLASEYRDTVAQWLARVTDSAGICSSEADFLNLLWMDSTVVSRPPSSQPLYHLFDDMGILYVRSSWGNGATVSAFKCGAFIGHDAAVEYSYDPGGGHVHPDAGAFQIFASGDWLIADDGYTWKTTQYQNTVVVNGVGQIGEGGSWFDGGDYCGQARQPGIVYAVNRPRYDYAMGDMAPAYPDSARVSEYFRNFVYIRPNVWVVADEFAFETASAVDMYFHSDYAFTPDGGAGQFSVTGPRGKLFVTRLSPGSDSAFLQPIRHTSGSYNDTIPALRVRHTGLTSGTHFTLLETTAASGTRQAWATVSDTGASPMLVVGTGTDTLRFAVVRNRADRNSPLLVDPSGVSRRPGTPGRGVALRVLQSRSTVRFVIGGNSGDTYRVAVYDVRGRVVWQAATTGGKAICWRFQDGRRPGAGRYVVRVTGSGVLADGWVSAY